MVSNILGFSDPILTVSRVPVELAAVIDVGLAGSNINR
jgi:hypothetical protein